MTEEKGIIHSNDMLTKEKAKGQKIGFKMFLIPAVIVGVIAGLITNNFGLGVVVAGFVLIGNWIGFSLGKK